MTIVNGQLSDFGLGVMGVQVPQIVFTPSGPAVAGTAVFATEPIVVSPSFLTGNFSVDLVPTEGLRPEVWYEVSIRWLPKSGTHVDGNWVQHDLLSAKVYVPDTSFIALADALEIPGGADLIWVGPTAPPNPKPYTKWLNSLTGDLTEWS